VLLTWSAPHSELTETVHGFEVKISRADWLAELRQPEKAEAWAQFCHTFSLVAADRRIVRDDLPDGWGLLIPHGTSLRMVVRPRRRDPRPMPTPIVVSIARAVQKTETAIATTATTLALAVAAPPGGA